MEQVALSDLVFAARRCVSPQFCILSPNSVHTQKNLSFSRPRGA